MPKPDKKTPGVAAFLSLVPGLGHAYLGRTRKAAALACIDAGLLLSLFLFPSRLTVVLAAGVYLMTALPAAVEVYLLAGTGRASPVLNSKPYVILMLLTTGINALPLLWQNENFSRRAKMLWTVAVPLLAVLFFGAVWRWGAQYAGK